jgi:hypothetical protein
MRVEDDLHKMSLLAFLSYTIGQMWQAKARSLGAVYDDLDDAVFFDAYLRMKFREILYSLQI